MPDDDSPGMYDPDSGRVDIEGAEQALGIDDESRDYLRMVALVNLIKQRLDISDSEIDQQYEIQLREQLKVARDSINSLVKGGLDEKTEDLG